MRLLLPLLLLPLVALPAAALEFPDLSTNTPRAHWHSLTECPKDYSVYRVTYRAKKANAKQAFDRLIHTHPAQLWSEPSRFVQLFDLGTGKSIRSAAEPVPALKPGQVISLDLKIAPGYRIPVAFEVTRVEPEKLHAVFGYVTTNVSQGVQDITFTQKGDSIEVIHDTCYQSGKVVRDKVFYPPIHHHLIRKFYEHFFTGK